jgi:hypothetical protein
MTAFEKGDKGASSKEDVKISKPENFSTTKSGETLMRTTKSAKKLV